jgi:hypothetical protein
VKPYGQNNQSKKDWRCGLSSSKCEALSSNPSIAKKKKKNPCGKRGKKKNWTESNKLMQV